MDSIKKIFKKNRCDMCDKKCGLIPFKCKCGGKFCSEHRYTFLHCCHLDYLSIERERLKAHLQKL